MEFVLMKPDKSFFAPLKNIRTVAVGLLIAAVIAYIISFFG